MKRTNANGIARTLAIKTINCGICGDEQQTQVGSACHRDNICIICANKALRIKKSRSKDFEIQ